MQQPRAGGAAESGCLAERCKVRITPEADQAVASQVTQHVAKLVQDDLIVELARLDLLDLRVPEAFQAHRRRACGFPPRLDTEMGPISVRLEGDAHLQIAIGARAHARIAQIAEVEIDRAVERPLAGDAGDTAPQVLRAIHEAHADRVIRGPDILQIQDATGLDAFDVELGENRQHRGLDRGAFAGKRAFQRVGRLRPPPAVAAPIRKPTNEM